MVAGRGPSIRTAPLCKAFEGNRGQCPHRVFQKLLHSCLSSPTKAWTCKPGLSIAVRVAFFNVRDDPNEHVDLARDPDYKSIFRNMHEKLQLRNKDIFKPERGSPTSMGAPSAPSQRSASSTALHLRGAQISKLKMRC